MFCRLAKMQMSLRMKNPLQQTSIVGKPSKYKELPAFNFLCKRNGMLLAIEIMGTSKLAQENQTKGVA